MMDVYEKMKELGVTLPKAPAKGGVYAQAKLLGLGFVRFGVRSNITESVKGKLEKDFMVQRARSSLGTVC